MSEAYAHELGEEQGHENFGWSFEPWAIIPMLIVAYLYIKGSKEINSRGKANRRPKMFLFWSGLIILALALMSPLHEYGERLFSAHMVEHELLMVVGVPLLVASQPGAILLWGMPDKARNFTIKLIRSNFVRSFWGGATELWTATIFHTVILWLWHLPYLFQSAVSNEGVHILQHLSFIISAVFFWSAVFDRDHRRYQQGLAALALFFTSMQAGLLGALFTFSTKLWYPNSDDPFPISGLTRFEDQSLAGLIMWIPACSIYVIAALIILARWFKTLEVNHAAVL